MWFVFALLPARPLSCDGNYYSCAVTEPPHRMYIAEVEEILK